MAFEFGPFEGPLGGGLWLKWEGLHDAGGGLWPRGEWVMEDSSFRTMVGAQQAYSRHEVAQLYAAVLALYGAAADPGKCMLARLQGFAC
jgi:hypothetical protein